MHPTSDETSGGYLTTSEAARYLGVSTRTIARYIEAGLLPVFWLPSGHRRIARADLDRIIRRVEAS